jgi:hypothetical protein
MALPSPAPFSLPAWFVTLDALVLPLIVAASRHNTPQSSNATNNLLLLNPP